MRPLERHLAACLVFFCASSMEAREIWREARSAHFRLVSNGSEKAARSVLARLEQFRRAMARVLPEHRRRDPSPTQVYAFRDFDSFASFLPRTEDGVIDAAGYFRRGPYKNIIAIDLSTGSDAYEKVLFHEYVHLILSLTSVDYPLWFQEGMAELYGGLRLSDDSVELGRADMRHRRVLFENPLMALEELLTASADWPLSASPGERAIFYAQSWAAIHYLIVDRGEEGHRRLARYLAARARGDDALDAFAVAFEADIDTAQTALGDYVDSGTFVSFRYDVAEMDWEKDVSVRTLQAAEVQHRWGELFLFTGRSKEALFCLEEAVRLDPYLDPAWETLGFSRLMEGRIEAAIPLLKRAVDGGGASPIGLYEYARALLQDYSGHGVTSIPAELADEAERSLTRSWQRDPSRSETARLLAFVHLVRGTRLEEATELTESALEIAPGSASLLYLYGQLQERRGEYEPAREALERVRADAGDEALREAASELLSRMEARKKAPGSP